MQHTDHADGNDDWDVEPEMTLASRIARIDRLAVDFRFQGDLTDQGFAILMLADLMRTIEVASDERFELFLDRAKLHLEEERDPDGEIRWTEGAGDWDNLPVGLAAEIDAREERLLLIADAYIPTSGVSAEDVVTDALADLWHWCEARGLPPIDRLQPKAEVVNTLAWGRLN
jgi:hypothetical protein